MAAMFSRRALIGPIVLVLLVVAGYPAYWFYAKGIAEDAFARWVEARRAEGYEVAHGPAEVGGFPMLIRLRVPDPAIAAPDRRWRWRGAAARLEMQPWDFHRYRLEFTGTHTFQVRTDAGPRSYMAEALEAFAIARFHGNGRLADLGLSITELSVDRVGARESKGSEALTLRQARLDVGRAETSPAGHTEKSLDLSLIAEDVHLAAAKLPLGGVVPKVRLVAEVMGALSDVSPAALQAWRKAGGTIEVPWLNIAWGPLDLRAKGTVALDEELRPLGALTADIRGYGETLSALADAGVMRRDVASAGRITLDLLAQPSKDDGRRVLTVPLTAQDGGFYVGPIRALTLPPVVPPAAN